MKLPSILLSFLFCINSLMAQSTPKVLILGIDGCRPDALVAANTPNLDALIANGTYSYDALTEALTWSGVGWSGMLTGVWRAKHGVDDNSFNGSNYAQYPHVFNHIEDCDPSLVTASIVHWGPINSQIVDQADYELTLSTDLAVRNEAVNYLTNQNPDILFLHFDDVDHAGHANSFLPTNAPYLQAIEDVDAHIGTVMTALTNRADYANEDWLIIVSTDHGGTASGHGGSSFIEKNIFVIMSGEDVLQQQISKVSTQKSFPDALSFNGTDTYIDIPDSPNYDFGTDQDFTVECMIQVNNINGDASIVGDKDWASGLNKGFVFSYVFSNGPQWKVNIGDGSNRLDLNGSAVNDGSWHHLAVSFDRDGLMSMYEDGVLLQSVDMSSIGDIDTPYPFAIGQDGTRNYGSWFDGFIADVKIWSAALDESTIVSQACNPPGPSHPNINDLIAYWPITEGNGTTINDLSNTQNNGAISGSSVNWNSNAGTFDCVDYSDTPRIVDIAVTALDYLCGSIDPTLDFDGISLLNRILPADLVSFTGYMDATANHFNWEVAAQEGVKHYELQRSSDGRQAYQIIATHSAQSNRQRYSLQDQQPLPQAYYRLKIVDFDGRIAYSDLLFLRRATEIITVDRVRPNPVNDFLVIPVHSTANEELNLRLRVLDLHGRTIQLSHATLVNGHNDLSMNTATLSPGLYYLILENNDYRKEVKFVKH